MSALSINEIRNLHKKMVVCPSCKDEVEATEMTEYQGRPMCEGCGESYDRESHDDPHGRNWES